MSEGSPAAGSAPQREERKVVTALFADLVGSTALAERLEPEEVKLVVGDAVGRVVTEVERLGGHVKDLAGDGVLAFFGAPVTSEDDPERAVRTGLAVLDELRAYGREVGEAWGIDGFRVEFSGVRPDRVREIPQGDEVDIIDAGFAQPMLDLFEEAGLEATLGPPAWTLYVAFDHSEERLAEAETRLALAHALDTDVLAGVLPGNITAGTGGLVPPALQGHTPDIAPRFDPTLARELLIRSGFAGKLVFAAPVGSVLNTLCETIVEMWRSHLGIDAEWNRVDFGEWVAEPDPWSLGSVAGSLWFPGYPDPEYFLRLLLHSESTDNVGRYADPAYDALIEQARTERDGKRRLEMFHAADRMAIAEQAAVIPIGYGSNAVVIKPWVSGWWEYGKSWSSYADLELDEAAREASAQESSPSSSS